MCESHAFLLQDGKEELILEDVVTVREKDGEVYLASIIGEEKTLSAEVSEINLLNHRILLTPLRER
jgi:predicted RNA-binding protein